MKNELLGHPKALAISVGLHLLVLGLIAFEFAFTEKPEIIRTGAVEQTVQAEVIDVAELEQRDAEKAAAVQREADARKQAEASKKADAEAKKKAEAKRQADARREADKKAKAEAAARAAEDKRKADAKRQADARRKADEKAKAEQARKAEAARVAEEKRKADEARIAEAKRKADEARRAEQERQRQEAEARRQAEAEQKRKEAELRARLEAEENQRRLKTLRDAYILAIRQKVERNWRRPAGSGKMPNCEVHVQQGPGGIILDVTFGACGGSTATYRASIENAVYKAEPLPKPGDPAIFERNLTFLFNPGEQ